MPEPDGSPLFTLLPLIACWRYEPREHLRPLAIARAAIPPSPLRDRVGYSDHDRFRGYVPVHFIPAYNLPVYASQRPLPDATQDSVRGCSLGFAAAAIADGRLQRACKAQPSQIRTGYSRIIRLVERFFPPIKVLHPMPCHRFDAKTRGRSPVR